MSSRTNQSLGISSNKSSKETLCFEIVKYSRSRPCLPLALINHQKKTNTHDRGGVQALPATDAELPAGHHQTDWSHLWVFSFLLFLLLFVSGFHF